MNELNKIRGYLIPNNQVEKSGASFSGVKYFVLGLDNKLHITSNLALIQFLASHSENIEKFYEKTSKHLTTLTFVDPIVISQITDFTQPEQVPFTTKSASESA